MYIFIFLKGMSCGDLIQYCIETCYGTCYLLSKGRDQDNSFINISIGSEIPLQHFVGIFIYFLCYKFSYWLFAYRYKLNLIFYKKNYVLFLLDCSLQYFHKLDSNIPLPLHTYCRYEILILQ